MPVGDSRALRVIAKYPLPLDCTAITWPWGGGIKGSIRGLHWCILSCTEITYIRKIICDI